MCFQEAERQKLVDEKDRALGVLDSILGRESLFSNAQPESERHSEWKPSARFDPTSKATTGMKKPVPVVEEPEPVRATKQVGNAPLPEVSKAKHYEVKHEYHTLFPKLGTKAAPFSFLQSAAEESAPSGPAKGSFTFGFGGDESDDDKPVEQPNDQEFRFGFAGHRFSSGLADEEEPAATEAPSKRKRVAVDDSSSDDDFMRTDKSDAATQEEWGKFKQKVRADSRNKAKSAKQNARKNKRVRA